MSHSEAILQLLAMEIVIENQKKIREDGVLNVNDKVQRDGNHVMRDEECKEGGTRSSTEKAFSSTRTYVLPLSNVVQ
ncbi:hypothetical protein TNCV_1933141 [Trichonephila clavipes]|nr:hypothetical protein TNCV_1933141 [Trichonephila clavipes]